MQVTFCLELADLRTAANFLEAHKKRHEVRVSWHPTLWWMAGFLLGVPLLCGLNAWRQPAWRTALAAQDWSALLPYSVFVIPLLTFVLAWLGAPLLRGLALRESPALAREMTLWVDEEGIRGAGAPTAWSEVKGVEATTDHVFVLCAGHQIFTVPRRAFSSEFAFLQFADCCHDLWASATDSDSLPPRD